MTQAILEVINARYQLQRQLGAGGMGVVYQTFDRLRGELIALKRVNVGQAHGSTHSHVPDSIPSDSFQLALAREFQVLATLRHPNIVSVLDYGFDADQHPFLTMELLERPRSLTQIVLGKSVEEKVGLLTQVLQALVYLHRRGTLHRDLKPENVLVSAGTQRLRVVDFGLAQPTDYLQQAPKQSPTGISGTFSYLAPELFNGKPATVATDLYAFGVMAYQVFAGYHPFDQTSLSILMGQILYKHPDVKGLDIPTEYQLILQALLAKNPQDRPRNAEEVIAAFSTALGEPLPIETTATRESLLSSAKLVGRDTELDQLLSALERAKAGMGGVWLVGGESGVGKSRLLEEVRIRALVDGCLVIWGQTSAGAALSHSYWREAARYVAVTLPLTDLEAGVLHLFVPDLETLLNRAIPPLPTLDNEGEQKRTRTLLVDLLNRLSQRQPLIILLEDLQWAQESLDILVQLSKISGDVRILVIGSYRDDERVTLPDEIPGSQMLKLARLSPNAIQSLTQSMLGAENTSLEVVDYLNQQTEGNAFFLVEVVRALAEEAGNLTHVGSITLPETILSKGLKDFVLRRLARLPETDQPLLKLAAVAGREIHPPLLMQAAGVDPTTLEAWITRATDSAILIPVGGGWQFAHDKLREGVLSALLADERILVYRQIAEVAEHLYGGQEKTYAPVLATYWGGTDNVDRERYWAGLAGIELERSNHLAAASPFLERALDLTPVDYPDQLYRQTLNRHYAGCLYYRGKVDDSERMLRSVIEFARQNGHDELESYSCKDLSIILDARGDYVQSEQISRQSLQAAERCVHNPSLEVRMLNRYISIRLRMRLDIPEVKTVLFPRFEARASHIRDRRLDLAFWLMKARVYRSDISFETLIGFYEQAILAAKEIGDLEGESTINSNLAVDYWSKGRYAEALPHIQLSVETARRLGNPWEIANDLNTLSYILTGLNQPEQALIHFKDALTRSLKLNAESLVLDILIGIAQAKAKTGSLAALTQAVEVCGMVQAHPAYNEDLEQTVQVTLRQIEESRMLAPDLIQTALERGKTLSIDQIAVA
jgi:tetratricopeptide (TPR) repeat protein